MQSAIALTNRACGSYSIIRSPQPLWYWLAHLALSRLQLSPSYWHSKFFKKTVPLVFTLKILKEVRFFLGMSGRKNATIAILLVIVLALLEAVGVASVMPFLAVLADPELIVSNHVLAQLFRVAGYWGIESEEGFLVVMGLLVLLNLSIVTAYRVITNYYISRYSEKLRHNISISLLKTYLHQPYTFFVERNSTDMVKSIVSEVDQLTSFVLQPFINMIAYSCVLFSILALLFIVHPLIATLCIVLFGGFYIAAFLIMKKQISNLGERRVIANQKRFLVLADAFGGIKETKATGRETYFLHSLVQPSNELSITQSLSATLNQIPKYLVEFLGFGLIISLITILMITSGGFSSNALASVLPLSGLYALAAYRIQPALQAIFSALASVRYGRVAMSSLYEDLQCLRGRRDLDDEENSTIKFKNRISFLDISFRHEKSSKLILNNVSFEINHGETVGIVGSTGAGKSTLADILLGLMRPTSGQILIDDVCVRHLNIIQWRRSLGYVPQNIYISDTSVYQNIAFGIAFEDIDKDYAEYCAKLANIHDFIEKDLPFGYMSALGERGVSLSGGQRQRIGIARALYSNPDLLIFDEATSALDGVTEAAVMDSILSLRNKKTIVIIAHRFNTLRSCDSIIFLEDGRIRSHGTYEYLMGNDPMFLKMSGEARRESDT
ncbi:MULTISPECIES: ABC transporter ATP-binding protein [unclassified Roseobacter]|uniref:ABC transporter ATP-binding protein n=1 Tax=unclassified Roseobacter TaxID=196798 RepID=UPI0030EC7711